MLKNEFLPRTLVVAGANSEVAETDTTKISPAQETYSSLERNRKLVSRSNDVTERDNLKGNNEEHKRLHEWVTISTGYRVQRNSLKKFKKVSSSSQCTMKSSYIALGGNWEISFKYLIKYLT